MNQEMEKIRQKKAIQDQGKFQIIKFTFLRRPLEMEFIPIFSAWVANALIN